MKYLVNLKTKEHLSIHDDWQAEYDSDLINFRVVDADPEGWIKHDGGECPLPDGTVFSVITRDGTILDRCDSGYSRGLWVHLGWPRDYIKYRPILNDNQRPDFGYGDSFVDDKPEIVKCKVGNRPNYCDPSPDDLLDRLRAAHKAANDLPDIIAELREVLGPELMEMLCTELNSKDFTKNDTKAWINWREGDVLECVDSANGLTVGNLYVVLGMDMGHPDIAEDDKGRTNSCYRHHFRFHSRPTKEQDNG